MDKNYRLIDTHAHLDEMENLDSVIERARQKGIIAIVAVGSDYKSNNKVLEIAEKYRYFVYPALGLHPMNLDGSSIDNDLKFIEANIQDIVAIGEIGLDYKKDIVAKSSKEFQKEALRSILSLAGRYDKPVSLHSRYAWRDTFTLVDEARLRKAVFHWYTGPTNVLRDILSRGYYVSVTLAAEYHEEHRRVVKEADLDSLLLETDAPVHYRGHRAEPADVVRSLHSIAGIKDLPLDIIANKTTANAMRLFGINAE